MCHGHVEWLSYRLKHSPEVWYHNPPAVGVTGEGWHGTLEDGTLTITFSTRFSKVREARAHVEKVLKGWEIHDRILGEGHGIQFVFEDARVVRPTTEGEGAMVLVPTARTVTNALAPSVRVGRNAYPKPPEDFTATVDVETMWWRFEQYQEGREPAATMAYFCLSLVENLSGGRRHVRRVYNIDKRVVDHIGRLASVRGGPMTARKVNKEASFTPLSSVETQWLEAAVKRMIGRVGEVAAGRPVAPLTLSDLPNLPE